MIPNYNKVLVLTHEDLFISLNDWQYGYGLNVGSAEIGHHYKFTEPKFAENIARYGKLIVCGPLMKVLDRYRELIEEPNNINSFNRDDKKQEELNLAGMRTAKFSPHVVKMAADCDTYSEEDTKIKVKKMIQAGIESDIKIRVGFQQYLDAGQTFIHVDVCPMYYAKGMPRHNEPHPKVWEEIITW